MSKIARRYPFKRVCLVVTSLMIVLGGLSLLILYNVKVPNAQYDMKLFSIPKYLRSAVISLVFNIIFYYFSLNGLHRLVITRAGFKGYAVFVGKLIGICFVYFVLYDYYIRRTDAFNTWMSFSGYLFTYFISMVLYLGVSLAIVHINILRDEKRLRGVLEGQKRQLEMEKVQTNYLFLKAQINPHFLHNTLNFLYAKSLPYSSELSEGILTLSEIMRYSLDKEEDRGGKVLLTKEIEHVNNVIKIQQLRFDHSLQISFGINGEVAGLLIVPFVLITIVENAFKHGELKNPDYPISIRLTVSGDGSLLFRCVNKKKTGPRELSTGIGLDNTRKRLDLAYGENYSLYIKEQ
ncbi:MAG TPA: histidine kinase, partial [Chitinophagaceae bacterium]